jgi:hypothetical protein
MIGNAIDQMWALAKEFVISILPVQQLAPEEMYV